MNGYIGSDTSVAGLSSDRIDLDRCRIELKRVFYIYCTCSVLAIFRSRARIDAAISFMTSGSDVSGQALGIAICTAGGS